MQVPPLLYPILRDKTRVEIAAYIQIMQKLGL